MRRIHPVALAVAACIVAGAAALFATAAQAQPLEPQPRPAAPKPPAPTPPAPRFAPKIDDPMLAAPTPAATELASWTDARRLFRDAATEVRRAEAGAARAAALVGIAGAALRPNARATAGVSLDLLHPGTAPIADPEGTSPLVNAQLTASQALVDVAARRNRDAAGLDRRAADLDRVDAERRVTQRVARAIIAVAAAGRAAELNRVGLRASLERAALGRRTFELGAATELDVVRTEQDVALARAALVAGDEGLRRAREALALTLGVDGDVGVAPALAGDGLLAQLASQCRPLRGDETRADLAAAEADVAAARARRAEARAGYLPTVDLTTALSAYSIEESPGVRLPSWTVALVLNVPLWEGGLRRAAIAERAAAEEDAAAVSADVRRSAAAEIARARRGGEVAGALVAAAAESRALAERVDAMTRRSFEIGRATSLELVQSAAALRQAELTLSLREFERLEAQVDALLTEARCVP